ELRSSSRDMSFGPTSWQLVLECGAEEAATQNVTGMVGHCLPCAVAASCWRHEPTRSPRRRERELVRELPHQGLLRPSCSRPVRTSRGAQWEGRQVWCRLESDRRRRHNGETYLEGLVRRTGDPPQSHALGKGISWAGELSPRLPRSVFYT